MDKAPIALILFSNDLDRFLPMVEQERKAIEEALEQMNDTNRLKVIARSSVSIEEVFRLFNRYRGQIILFHFAGHANAKGLQFNQNFKETTLGDAAGLADLLGREAREGMLKLAFLNGCRTAPQVEAIRQAGVPSIIATHWEIPDQKAVQLAEQLYRNLANADQADPFSLPPPDILNAFDSAIAFLKTKNEKGINISRSAGRVQLQIGSQIPWGLWTTDANWTLPFSVAAEKKPFNQQLIPHLIKAIQPFSKNARLLMSKTKDSEDWEFQINQSQNAKRIIVSRFVGVLGTQLRKLIAIGETPISDSSPHNYLNNCIITGKRVLQLLCFSLISRFWDLKKKKNYPLTDKQSQILLTFFTSIDGQHIEAYLDLLTQLHQIFEDHQLPFPMSELSTFGKVLQVDSDFIKAYKKLHDLERWVGHPNLKLANCYTAERQLTTILVQLSFLVKYKMMSIKSISYDEMRNKPPRYLYTYAALGSDSNFNLNTEKVNYTETATNTDAILLYKGRYEEVVNLFPFIIDLNALTFEGGAKVCFYSCRDIKDHSLCYRFMEDNETEYLSYKNILGPNTNINQLMSDLDNRKILKLDTVYLQFQEAMNDILGKQETEAFWEEEEEDF